MKALILVDLQNDFMPGGALPVPGGDEVIPTANRLVDKFKIVVATQDWHPSNHGSFAANHHGRKTGDVIELNGLSQILWPVHCVQGCPGAELHLMLKKDKITKIFKKGQNPELDSYSGFFDNARRAATGLGDFLKAERVTDVYILGLATDYCVKFTALDAVDLGFKTYLIKDACRGVELNKGDVLSAVSEMKNAGITILSAREISNFFN